jgi:hypothetical protein
MWQLLEAASIGFRRLWKTVPTGKTEPALFDLRVTPRAPYVLSLTPRQLCRVTTGVARVTTFEA